MGVVITENQRKELFSAATTADLLRLKYREYPIYAIAISAISLEDTHVLPLTLRQAIEEAIKYEEGI